uniref:hypothetical protein n=1 Tax=Xenorhabdus lircayensis TaxID=2763499 RepID=UPI001E331071|nr:hypothetical protein [Xenorhabdus lircayensis]
MHSPTNAWEQELLSLHIRLAPLFHHPGPQQRSLAYLRGLLSDVERKNGWQLAEWISEFLETNSLIIPATREIYWDIYIEFGKNKHIPKILIAAPELHQIRLKI